jgi:hypothetical protein
MFYIDVDNDPNTCNSSRAELRLPEGAEVTYARLYWGGNLRIGEQKPPRDSRRVLIAEPGGAYKAVLADSVIGHRVARGADAFQASADVTKPVRTSGSGLYTVAQANVARGRSSAAGPGARARSRVRGGELRAAQRAAAARRGARAGLARPGRPRSRPRDAGPAVPALRLVERVRRRRAPDTRVVRPLGGPVSPTGSLSDPLADSLTDSVADDEKASSC